MLYTPLFFTSILLRKHHVWGTTQKPGTQHLPSRRRVLEKEALWISIRREVMTPVLSYHYHLSSSKCGWYKLGVQLLVSLLYGYSKHSEHDHISSTLSYSFSQFKSSESRACFQSLTSWNCNWWYFVLFLRGNNLETRLGSNGILESIKYGGSWSSSFK